MSKNAQKLDDRYPHGWTEADAWKQYEESSTGAESGRSFEGFLNYQWGLSMGSGSAKSAVIEPKKRSFESHEEALIINGTRIPTPKGYTRLYWETTEGTVGLVFMPHDVALKAGKGLADRAINKLQDAGECLPGR